MSPEQLIVLAAILIATLVRAAQQTAEAKRKESLASRVRAEQVAGQSVPRREARPPEHRAARRLREEAREVQRRAPRPEAPLLPAPGPRGPRFLPSDVAALRRAIVLATLLGPPRGLKDATALDSRER